MTIHTPPCGPQFLATAAPELYDAFVQARAILFTIYSELAVDSREDQKARVILAKIGTLTRAINAAAGQHDSCEHPMRQLKEKETRRQLIDSVQLKPLNDDSVELIKQFLRNMHDGNKAGEL